MADDFPETRDTASFLDSIEEEGDKPPAPSPKKKISADSPKGLLGMTPVQTFVISALFFFIVVAVGFFLMLVTNKMVI